MKVAYGKTPIIYALDNRYYKIGKVFGKGYQEGRGLFN
jgi:hypothetical protein